MNFSKSFIFKVCGPKSQAKLVCKFLTANNENITIEGDSVEDILYQFIKTFPHGIKARGYSFSGNNHLDAKKNFCELMRLGLEMGYFSEKDFGNFDIDSDDQQQI